MATLFFISAPIYPFVREEEETEIATAISAAGTTLVVDNTQGFSGDDYIILGKIGRETTEIVKISSVTNDTTLSIGAVKFAHAVDDPVRRTPFNQIKFYYCSTAGGTYSADGSAEAMQVDNDDEMTGHSTTLTDGRTKYWKATYYNSTSGNETSQSDSEAVYGAIVLYCTPKDVYDFLDVDESKLDQSAIGLAIEGVTVEIESKSNTVFYEKTVTDEYHDGKGAYDDEYFLKQTPIVSITTLSTTQSAEGTASPTFTTLTNVTDYERDFETGRLAIVNSSYVPPVGRHRLKCTYVAGRSTVPWDIRTLTVLMVARDLAKIEAYSELILSSENIKEKIAEVNEDFVMKRLAKYRKLGMANT